MVCAIALSACGDAGQSEDIGQEVFLVAWKELGALREPGKMHGWLCGIARNLARDAVRRKRRVPTHRADALSEDEPGDGVNPREEAVRAEEAALMWRALEGIPAIYREPTVLFYCEQQSTGAVAAALEISAETVRQRLVRGRAMLTGRMAALVHVRLGSKRGWSRPVVKGWFVVSDGRAAAGFFALGNGAVARISMGIGAVGIVSIGVFSAGMLALGLAAAGGVSAGVMAVGAYAAKGTFVAAGELADGYAVVAAHANDEVAKAFFRDHGFILFSGYFKRYATMPSALGWVMPLVLTGWQLARRKSRAISSSA